jgi:hypothetical protein
LLVDALTEAPPDLPQGGTDARLAGAPPVTGGWQLGLTAVVEAADGSLSYWALRHPVARPDFHHRDGFAQTLNLI